MSSAGERTRSRAEEPSPSTWASPRTTATGSPAALPLTRSPAAASSSAVATTVELSGLPWASVAPRRSSRTRTPAEPIATSVSPVRHGRPKVSVTTTPTSTDRVSRTPARIAAAEASGSWGSSSTVPGAVLEASTPAAAITRPCRFSTIRSGPRRATTRTVSASIAASRESASTMRPSALETIFEVTSRTSPSRRSGAAVVISFARSSPGLTSGIPSTARTSYAGTGVTGRPPPAPARRGPSPRWPPRRSSSAAPRGR